MVRGNVRCIDCGHIWKSKADKPRCSKCGSRRVEVEDVKNIDAPNQLPDYSAVFNAFDEGRTLIDVVKQGICDPDRVRDLWEKYEELREVVSEIEVRPKLEKRIEDLELNMEMITELIIKEDWVKEKCSHYIDGYCRELCFESKPTFSYVMRSIEEDGRWYIDPDVRFCALCPINSHSFNHRRS